MSNITKSVIDSVAANAGIMKDFGPVNCEFVGAIEYSEGDTTFNAVRVSFKDDNEKQFETQIPYADLKTAEDLDEWLEETGDGSMILKPCNITKRRNRVILSEVQ